MKISTKVFIFSAVVFLGGKIKNRFDEVHFNKVVTDTVYYGDMKVLQKLREGEELDVSTEIFDGQPHSIFVDMQTKPVEHDNDFDDTHSNKEKIITVFSDRSTPNDILENLHTQKLDDVKIMALKDDINFRKERATKERMTNFIDLYAPGLKGSIRINGKYRNTQVHDRMLLLLQQGCDLADFIKAFGQYDWSYQGGDTSD